MKFDREPRYERFAWTARKLALASKRGERERARDVARYPLLADFIEPSPAFDADAEAARREELTQRAEQRMRDLHARLWREARRDARAASPAQQQEIRERWAAWRGARKATYFRYVVDVVTGVMERRREAFLERERRMLQRILAQQQAQSALPFEVSLPAKRAVDEDAQSGSVSHDEEVLIERS
jgi:hypothetical protein